MFLSNLTEVQVKNLAMALLKRKEKSFHNRKLYFGEDIE
jgi:hypothetical protein